MSDFDKEAEREKLREKFERDREKRQQSERMSELLLKGATMTNKHHDCGSPIFRWQGEEFCPSCEGADGIGGADVGAGETGSDEETAGGTDVTAGSTGDAGDEAVEETAGVDDAAAAADTPPTEIDVTAEPTADDGAGTDADRSPDRRTRPTAGTGSADGSQATTGGRTTGGRTTGGGAAGKGVAAARASLERTLAAVAREAEETGTDDLARKRNLIAATREAAEALEATRRASRQ